MGTGPMEEKHRGTATRDDRDPGLVSLSRRSRAASTADAAASDSATPAGPAATFDVLPTAEAGGFALDSVRSSRPGLSVSQLRRASSATTAESPCRRSPRPSLATPGDHLVRIAGVAHRPFSG